MMEGKTFKLHKQITERDENAYHIATVYTDKSIKSIVAQLTIFK